MSGGPGRRDRWVPVASCGAAYEADIAAAKLDAAGIPVQLRNNDTVGIFGPNFGGFTARGIDLLVPESFAADARLLLGAADRPDA